MHLDITPETSKTLEDILFGHQLPIFLEILPSDDERDGLPPFDKENDVILFLKMYDPVNESLHYFGHWCVPICTTFSKGQNLLHNVIIEFALNFIKECFQFRSTR